jgi:hypothetical protein
MRASLILLLALGVSIFPSTQASAPVTHGPSHLQLAGNQSPGALRPLAVPRPLAVSQPRAVPQSQSLTPAAQAGSDPTCAAGVSCGTSVTFTVSPRKTHLVPAVPVTG